MTTLEFIHNYYEPQINNFAVIDLTKVNQIILPNNLHAESIEAVYNSDDVISIIWNTKSNFDNVTSLLDELDRYYNTMAKATNLDNNISIEITIKYNEHESYYESIIYAPKEE